MENIATPYSHIQYENENDENGNPAGGHAEAVGIDIFWQSGPLGTGPDRKERNGAFVEDLIYITIQRLSYYQESRFKSEYNANAIEYLEKALACLHARTAERTERGVEGTHEV